MRATIFTVLLPLAFCGNVAADDGADIAARGTGNVRSYDASGFTTVSLAGSDDVNVRVGGAFAVRAEGDPALLDTLTIRRDGDALVVSRRWAWRPGKVRVLVTMPTIAGAAVGGSGNLRVDHVRGGRFAARLSGSGNITLDQVAAQGLDVAISGSGNVAAAGTAQRVAARIGGSGNFTAPRLTARGGDVRIAGSGSVRTVVAGDATVRVAGSGDVDLGPAARCTVRKAGSGSVRCGG